MNAAHKSISLLFNHAVVRFLDLANKLHCLYCPTTFNLFTVFNVIMHIIIIYFEYYFNIILHFIYSICCNTAFNLLHVFNV